VEGGGEAQAVIVSGGRRRDSTGSDREWWVAEESEFRNQIIH